MQELCFIEGVISDFHPVWKVLLELGHLPCYLAVLAAGILLHRRERYLNAVLILTAIMFWNALLKSWFKVPLFPHLGNGYAFPSGHMHAAAVFYGYVLLSVRKPWTCLLYILICVGEGAALVACLYHDWLDVCGALGFTIAELWIIFKIEKNKSFHNILFAFITACLGLWYVTMQQAVPLWLWGTFLIFCGTFFGMKIANVSYFHRFLILMFGIVLYKVFSDTVSNLILKQALLGFFLTCLPTLPIFGKNK